MLIIFLLVWDMELLIQECVTDNTVASLLCLFQQLSLMGGHSCPRLIFESEWLISDQREEGEHPIDRD